MEYTIFSILINEIRKSPGGGGIMPHPQATTPPCHDLCFLYRALESQLKLSMKASEENTPPSKLQLEEAKEISKRSVENKKYLDDLVR